MSETLPSSATDLDLRRSEARFRSLVQASAFDIWYADPQGHLIADMPGWRGVTGQAPADLEGDGWADGIHPDHRARVLERWNSAVRDRQPYACEYPIVSPDGTERIVEARAVALVEDGAVVEWVGVSQDVTEQREAERDLAEQHRLVETLNQIGATVSAELDLGRLVQSITDLTTTLTGAQFGAFFYTGRDSAGEALLLYTLAGAPREAFERYPNPRNTEIFAPTFAGDAPVRIDDVLVDARYGTMAPYHGMPEGHLPVRSYLAVPVVSRTGEVHGGLFFGHGEPAVFDARHEQLVVGVAAQAAVALDNARLYEAERTARAAAEATQRRMEVVARASEELAESLDVAATADAVARLLVEEVADGCGVHLLNDGGSLVLVALQHRDLEQSELLRRLMVEYPVTQDQPDGPGAAVRTGEPSVLRTVDPSVLAANATGGDAHLALMQRIALTAAVSVPLRARGRTVGVATVLRATGSFSDSDIAVVEEVGRRASLALDTAVLYQRERSAALTLQRSLLPQGVPAVPGAAMAYRYVPGAAGVEVGGDWYDVIPLPEGRTALVVGDVMGRGTRAAAIMGTLRTAVRAYVLEDHPPAEVLTRVDRMLEHSEDATLVTCAVAIFDPVSAMVTISVAGHLPPVLAQPDGAASLLEVDPGLPLGVGGGVFSQIDVEVEPCSTLLLYTDGLVEDPASGVDRGLATLTRALEEALGRDLSTDEVAEHVLQTCRPGSAHDDDIALLLIQRAPAPLDVDAGASWHELERSPTASAQARSLVSRELGRWGLRSMTDRAALLASELVTNAVRHASGQVRLGVQRLEDRVRVCVVDAEPDRRPVVTRQPLSVEVEDLAEGGRGMFLVDALADAWGAEPTDDGKVVWFELVPR